MFVLGASGAVAGDCACCCCCCSLDEAASAKSSLRCLPSAARVLALTAWTGERYHRSHRRKTSRFGMFRKKHLHPLLSSFPRLSAKTTLLRDTAGKVMYVLQDKISKSGETSERVAPGSLESRRSTVQMHTSLVAKAKGHPVLNSNTAGHVLFASTRASPPTPAADAEG